MAATTNPPMMYAHQPARLRIRTRRMNAMAKNTTGTMNAKLTRKRVRVAAALSTAGFSTKKSDATAAYTTAKTTVPRRAITVPNRRLPRRAGCAG
jgi:hypothetical protein